MSAEPAPIEQLGPPVSGDPGLGIQPVDSRVEITPSRRSARVRARWLLSGPPGSYRLTLPSSLFQVDLAVAPGDGSSPQAVAADLIQREDAQAPLPIVDLRVDPSSGKVYARGQPVAPRPPRYEHRLEVTLPPAGRLYLSASAVLSSGHDRDRRRKQVVEMTHALHARPDFFVYHFAVKGPQGRIEIAVPARTIARALIAGGVLRVGAAMGRPFPLGLTAGLGASYSDAPDGVLTQGLARAGLDLLLPHGDALQLAADFGTAFTGRHQLSLALCYQLYSPWVPFLPIGGHLQVGPAAEIWSSDAGDPRGTRWGLRLGLGLNLVYVGLALTADLFPQKEPLAEDRTGERYITRFRIATLVTLGL